MDELEKPRTYLHLNAYKFFEMAIIAYKNTLGGWGERQYGATDAIASVLFATMSVEAFMNELPELATGYPEQKKFVKNLSTLLATVEESQGQIKLKLLVANIAISEEVTDLFKNRYQDFVSLVKLRNELVHLKPSDEFNVNVDGKVSPSKRKLINTLKGLNILAKPDTYLNELINKESPLPFVELVSTPAVAKWACNTACDTVHTLVDSMPESMFRNRCIKPYVNKYWVRCN
jgi:hypothetical protein